ncbi:hypothetical protein [Verminephrobacter aporrectodeae]|uniref:hypothetical protein n=1 Tax=Verminephrobacter aporrectodeae TaxID=1110389 RepID=UPI0022437E39|nr:hypothetical protein [Verminephrobacter aporrectodeae]
MDEDNWTLPEFSVLGCGQLLAAPNQEVVKVIFHGPARRRNTNGRSIQVRRRIKE